MEESKTYHILNLGAGVQSTALYLMFLGGEFDERIDHAVFADTQEEPDSVYEHLEWLKTLGGPPILTDTAGKLGDDLIHGMNSTGQRFASITAFTSLVPGKTGGMLRRQCTAEYKINVAERIIRRQIVGLEYRQRVPKGVNCGAVFRPLVRRAPAGLEGEESLRRPPVGGGPVPAFRPGDDTLGLRGLPQRAVDPP